MKFEFKALDKDTFYKKVDQFRECLSVDVKEFILNSEIIYNNTYDFMFKFISISIIKYNDYLYLLNDVDGDKSIEPLLIQFDDRGNLLDSFLKDFIDSYEGDLSNYYINYIEFSRLMEEVRTTNP